MMQINRSAAGAKANGLVRNLVLQMIIQVDIRVRTKIPAEVNAGFPGFEFEASIDPTLLHQGAVARVADVHRTEESAGKLPVERKVRQIAFRSEQHTGTRRRVTG